MLGALARVLLALRQVKLEQADEEVELARRTHVPIEPIASIDPTDVGVDAAAQTILPGGEIPRYLPRTVDGELRTAVREAIDNDGRWIVVAVGRSKVGKSRALFEALRHCGTDSGLRLVAPVDGTALRSLLAPGETPRSEIEHSLLWLDDLEPFLNEGVTFQMLREWHDRTDGGIVTATCGGKGNDIVDRHTSGKLATLANEILQHAREVRIQATTSRELDPLRSELAGSMQSSIEQHGLAAFLVAGTLLERKLFTSRHALGEAECPEGMALASAAIDWARCGRTDPIAPETLRNLWSGYLPAGSQATDAGFQTALTWSLRPVAGTIALLQSTDEIGSSHGVDGYRAYDYVVRLVGDRPDTEPPHDATWARAIGDAADAQALAVGTSAYLHGRHEDAIAAFKKASSSSSDELAAAAILNLAITFDELQRPGDAIADYDDLLARFVDAPEPALRETVAKAMINKGAALGELDRFEETVMILDDLLARFIDAPEPALREAVAVAMVNKGAALGQLDRSEEAISVYDGLLARFPNPREEELREQVALALMNKQIRLAALGRPEEAIAALDDLLKRFPDPPEQGLREVVAMALFHRGVRLGKLDRSEEAILSYDALLRRFMDAPELKLREQVAMAMINKAARLGALSRPREAIAILDEVIVRFKDAPEQIFRTAVARAIKGREPVRPPGRA